MNRLPCPEGPWDVDLTPSPPPRVPRERPWLKSARSATPDHRDQDAQWRGIAAREDAPTAAGEETAGPLAWYALMGAVLAAAARSLTLDAAQWAQPRDAFGPLVVAAVIGGFASLGIGLADLVAVSGATSRLVLTALAGTIVGTAGSFVLVAPVFLPLPVLVRMLALSVAVGLVRPWAEGRARGTAVLAAAGLAAGVLTSLGPVVRLYDPYPWPAAQAAWLMAAIGLAVGIAREARDEV